jgi:hypothetical protein
MWEQTQKDTHMLNNCIKIIGQILLPNKKPYVYVHMCALQWLNGTDKEHTWRDVAPNLSLITRYHATTSTTFIGLRVLSAAAHAMNVDLLNWNNIGKWNYIYSYQHLYYFLLKWLRTDSDVFVINLLHDSITLKPTIVIFHLEYLKEMFRIVRLFSIHVLVELCHICTCTACITTSEWSWVRYNLVIS